MKCHGARLYGVYHFGGDNKNKNTLLKASHSRESITYERSESAWERRNTIKKQTKDHIVSCARGALPKDLNKRPHRTQLAAQP